MTILTLEGIHKSYGLEPLLQDLSFSLADDEKMGVIGANGSGKTTLLRIIAGQEPLDAGRIVMPSGRKVAYLPQNPAFEMDQTVLDAVFDEGDPGLRRLHDYEAACQALRLQGGTDAGLQARVAELAHQLDVTGGWELEAHATALLSRLGITDTEAPIQLLSGGQRKRVALARALLLAPDLLILDEPTNHLDTDTIAWLETFLSRFSGALLLVTHDRYFLERVTNRMLEIDHGQAQRFEGNYGYYLEKKEEQAVLRATEAHKREQLIRHELAWLRRGAQARTTKQKARIQRAETLMAEPKDGPDKSIDLATVSTRLGNKVLSANNLSKSFEGRTLFQSFTHTFTRTDRIGIVGANGSGKTTLLNILAGRLAPDEGEVEVGQTAVIGYYDQESEALEDDLRVIDYIRNIAEVVRASDGSLITASQMLERFLFAPAAQYTPIGRLSGGERRRLYLLKTLMGAPNVLLLDEPTNDFDIPTLIALENYLDAFSGCLVVASHDRYFLDRTVEHLFYIDESGQWHQYPGPFESFQARRDAEKEAQVGSVLPVKEKKEKPELPPPSGPRKLSYKEKRELEQLEARIEASEARKAEIEAQLAAETQDYTQVHALYTELQTLTTQLDEDIERWLAVNSE